MRSQYRGYCIHDYTSCCIVTSQVGEDVFPHVFIRDQDHARELIDPIADVTDRALKLVAAMIGRRSNVVRLEDYR